MTTLKHITNNPTFLTQEEVEILRQARWYIYVYGSGLIFTDNATWNCTDTVGAKHYLDELKIPEKK